MCGAGRQRDFGRLASQVYLGLRDGSLDPEAAFDLACLLMDEGQSGEAVRVLAEQSVAGTDPARLASAAGQVLDESGFEPDFDTEPRLVEALDLALAAVRADVQATGLGSELGLSFVAPRDLRTAFAFFRGSFSWASGIFPGEGRDRVSALVLVADDVQDSIMGQLMVAWPVCPAHQFGGHPREHDSQAVWWCTGDGGHVIALIGYWGERAGYPGRSRRS